MGKNFTPSQNPCKDWKLAKLINPRTGRAIKDHGPTFKKLERECREIQKIKLWAFNRFYKQAKPDSKSTDKFVSEVKSSDFISVPMLEHPKAKYKAEDIAEGLKKYNKNTKLNLKVAKMYLDHHKL